MWNYAGMRDSKTASKTPNAPHHEKRFENEDMQVAKPIQLIVPQTPALYALEFDIAAPKDSLPGGPDLACVDEWLILTMDDDDSIVFSQDRGWPKITNSFQKFLIQKHGLQP